MKKILAAVLACSLAVIIIIGATASSLLLGDVNLDGRVTAADARLALRASANLDPLTGDARRAADANKSGNITSADARIILRVSAGLENPLGTIVGEEDSSLDEEPIVTEPTAPTTAVPTTRVPTTAAPTTAATTTEEPTTEEPTTEEPTTEPVQRIDYPSIIDSFLAAEFYATGTMINEAGEETPVKMASGGDKTEIGISSSGFDVNMLLDGDTTYFKTITGDGEKYYVKLTKFVMQTFGIDMDIVSGGFSFGSPEDFSPPVKSQDTFRGDFCDVYTFAKEGGIYINFFCVGDEVRCVSIINPESGTTTLVIDTLTTEIPADMLTLDGYTRTLFANLMTILASSML